MMSRLGTEAVENSEQALVRFVRLVNTLLGIARDEFESEHYRADRRGERPDNAMFKRQHEIMDECDALLRRYGPQWAFELARLTGREMSASRFSKSPTLEQLGYDVNHSERECNRCGHVWFPVLISGHCPQCDAVDSKKAAGFGEGK